MSGFFSALKKEVMTIGQTKTVDSAFDTAKANYDAFVFSTQTMKAHVDAWHVNAKGMCASGEHVSNDFKNVMQQLSTHPFSKLAADGKATGSAMHQTWESCEHALQSTTLMQFKQLEAQFQSLKERMKAREAARLDFDYRTGKVKSAQADRDKLLAKGKAEAPKDAEKRVLEEQKLEAATKLWHTTNDGLIADLTHLHDQRHVLLGNVYIGFVTIQKEWLRAYANASDSLSVPVVTPALAFNLHPDAKAGAGPQHDGGTAADLDSTGMRGTSGSGNPFGVTAVGGAAKQQQPLPLPPVPARRGSGTAQQTPPYGVAPDPAHGGAPGNTAAAGTIAAR